VKQRNVISAYFDSGSRLCRLENRGYFGGQNGAAQALKRIYRFGVGSIGTKGFRERQQLTGVSEHGRV
jgi:hypothetical protein